MGAGATVALILEAPRRLRPAPPELRAAVTGWLWLMDGAILDWLEHRDLDARGAARAAAAARSRAPSARARSCQVLTRSTMKRRHSFGPMLGGEPWAP